MADAQEASTSSSDESRSDGLIEIRLPMGRWTYDPARRLGSPGGFASVFEGTSEHGQPAAVKRFNYDKAHLAEREFHVGEYLRKKDLRNVMLIYDCGLDANSGQNFIVMPRADECLSDLLKRETRLGEAAAIEILLQILHGLDEIPEIAHRDLKPSNILRCKGLGQAEWKIGDFGIAKLLEEATSEQTFAGFRSAPYAAPEQWRGEKSSRDTDLYALGCIAYQLVAGRTPFDGPDPASFQKQHLEILAEKDGAFSNPFWLAIQLCLRKHRQSRPTSARLRDLLQQVKVLRPSSSSSGREAVRRTGEKFALQIAEREARQQMERQESQRRTALAKEGNAILRDIVRRLFTTIEYESHRTARAAELDDNIDRWVLNFGRASVSVEFKNTRGGIGRDVFSQSKLDVAAYAVVTVASENPSRRWSASLWYLDMARNGSFRWYEVGYQPNPIIAPLPDAMVPTFLEPQHADAVHGLGNGAQVIAFGPRPIDDEDVDSFIDRWSVLIALAAEGRLEPPKKIPLGDDWPNP